MINLIVANSVYFFNDSSSSLRKQIQRNSQLKSFITQRQLTAIKRFSAQWTTKRQNEKNRMIILLIDIKYIGALRCQANAEVNWESKFENTDKWSPFIHDYVNEFIIWINMLGDILNYAGDGVRSRYVGVFLLLGTIKIDLDQHQATKSIWIFEFGNSDIVGRAPS